MFFLVDYWSNVFDNRNNVFDNRNNMFDNRSDVVDNGGNMVDNGGDMVDNRGDVDNRSVVVFVTGLLLMMYVMADEGLGRDSVAVVV